MKNIIYTTLFFFTALPAIAQVSDLSILRSQALFDIKDYNSAIEECNSGLLDKNDHRLLLIKGESLLETAKHIEAKKCFTQASTLKAGSGNYGLAKFYALNGEYDNALKHIERHLKSEYRLPKNTILLEDAFSELESTQGWKKLWSNKWYTELEEGLSEAHYLAKTNRESELAELVSKLEPLYKKESNFDYIKGLYLSVLGSNTDAVNSFKKSLETDKSNPDKYLRLIESYEKLGEYFKASQIASEALKEHSAKKVFILLQAKNLNKIANNDKALSSIKKYLEILPKDEKANSLAGDIQLSRHAYSEALKHYSFCIEKYPSKPSHFVKRAKVYSQTSTWEYAINDYSMALDLNPNDATAYYYKGFALLQSGNVDDACHDFKMALLNGYKKASAQISKNCIK